MQTGDEKAKLRFEDMAYKVTKEIAAMSIVLKGQVDAILITSGVVHGKWFVNQIAEGAYKISPVDICPDEDEMKSLAMGVLRILNGEIKTLEYK